MTWLNKVTAPFLKERSIDMAPILTQDFTRRWLFRVVGSPQSAMLQRQTLTVVGLAAMLCAALFLNKRLVDHSPNLWMVLVLVLAAGMMRVRYSAAAGPALHLWKWLGALSALYAVLHYPLMPALDTPQAHWFYGFLIAAWLLAVACGLGCLRYPSLALAPPAYLLWSKLITHDITGLRHRHTLDVAPLPEVSICIALGLLIVALYHRRALGRSMRARESAEQAPAGIVVEAEFVRIVTMLAICIHLANYFWSFLAKLMLDGPFLSWIYLNNPLNIYLAASDDGHITFSDFALASQSVGRALDATRIPANVFVFIAQAAALLGFVMPRRALVLLLLAFDVMHLAIAVAAGANFWPWIFLNLVVASVVVRKDFPHPRPLVGLGAAGFICISPLLANVALLGWYDSGANNNVQMLVETKTGERVPVSPNFYTFYSYPLSHMKYGMPEPETAFNVGNPNGGTRDYHIVEAARRCDTKALIQPGKVRRIPQPEFSDFIVNYHRMAQSVRNTVGFFPYDYYPHHFYVMPGRMRRFEDLDLADVRAYIYRRDSVCLSFVNGAVRRKVVSTGELRIDLPQENAGVRGK